MKMEQISHISDILFLLSVVFLFPQCRSMELAREKRREEICKALAFIQWEEFNFVFILFEGQGAINCDLSWSWLTDCSLFCLGLPWLIRTLQASRYQLWSAFFPYISPPYSSVLSHCLFFYYLLYVNQRVTENLFTRCGRIFKCELWEFSMKFRYGPLQHGEPFFLKKAKHWYWGSKIKWLIIDGDCHISYSWSWH